jgi:hypothetical protein
MWICCFFYLQQELAIPETAIIFSATGFGPVRLRLMNGGALVSTGIEDAGVAGRGAAGLVKSGTKVIANDNYEYALAA